ncbi:hypothetical protein IF1G_01910 [Cordyceps javanica]|uniref:Uncharacterized protein n=1 Tax=Cordyceps javanica TaxID=43265 RepID=A0A545VD94_9HYPO|nr:hypothetical protein IF1G_01910 [Cordyceps javanica]TQW10630.1 hypothetical protein IF2G_01572 [Cordyceps javanica]
MVRSWLPTDTYDDTRGTDVDGAWARDWVELGRLMRPRHFFSSRSPASFRLFCSLYSLSPCQLEQERGHPAARPYREKATTKRRDGPTEEDVIRQGRELTYLPTYLPTQVLYLPVCLCTSSFDRPETSSTATWWSRLGATYRLTLAEIRQRSIRATKKDDEEQDGISKKKKKRSKKSLPLFPFLFSTRLVTTASIGCETSCIASLPLTYVRYLARASSLAARQPPQQTNNRVGYAPWVVPNRTIYLSTLVKYGPEVSYSKGQFWWF